MPGAPQYGLPFLPFVLLTVEYSVLLTWMHLHTRGTVLTATLTHGAINLSQGLFLIGSHGASRYWLLALDYGAAALAVAVMGGPDYPAASRTNAPKPRAAATRVDATRFRRSTQTLPRHPR